MIRSSCNSHYVSHFAAFFIVAGTKRSTVKRLWILVFASPQMNGNPLSIRVNVWIGIGLGRKKLPPQRRRNRTNETNHLGLFLITRSEGDFAPTDQVRRVVYMRFHVNDPSAGSPTETLLRLLLPLNEQICTILTAVSTRKLQQQPPKDSSIHPIGRSDGRCVQRAGT